MKTIQIDLQRSNYRYEVKIGNEIISEVLSETLSNYSEKRIFLITNSTLSSLYPEFRENAIPGDLQSECLILPDGEEYKTLETVTQIFDFLVEKKANRKSILIAFGGGVIGDISGFAASAFMRGISYIQIPTTLLSQVDSGIGGKTGINHQAGKNLIGAFKQPYQTIIDVNFLKTLPQREFIAGYAELIKHGLIRDPYLFQILNQKKLNELKADEELLIDSIFRSCEVKARVVEEDEKETSQRAILNFGHTFGHFLETYTNYQQLLHGEAVIIGMDFAAWWSLKKDFLDKADFEIIHNHLSSLGISKTIPKVTKEAFVRIVEYDKKFSSEGIRFVGLTGIGQARIFDRITAESLWDNLLTYIQSDALLKIS